MIRYLHATTGLTASVYGSEIGQLAICDFSTGELLHPLVQASDGPIWILEVVNVGAATHAYCCTLQGKPPNAIDLATGKVMEPGAGLEGSLVGKIRHGDRDLIVCWRTLGQAPRTIFWDPLLRIVVNSFPSPQHFGFNVISAATVAGTVVFASSGGRMLFLRSAYGQAVCALDSEIKDIVHVQERQFAVATENGLLMIDIFPEHFHPST